jgi:hypothetical protein
MRTVMVRYKTLENQTEENARLVRAVYDELALRAPAGFRYVTFRLADGVSYVHLAAMDSGESPLGSVPAFQAFQENIRARCVEPPALSEVTVVGAYGVSDFGPRAREQGT